jgi:hypothetical protein
MILQSTVEQEKELLKDKCKLVFLMSFGHTGIDWMHSLLDNHEQIFIMPSFSFYRSWKLLEASKITSVNQMTLLWTNEFNSDIVRMNDDTKKFNNYHEVLAFKRKLHQYLVVHGIGKETVLWGIHEAYQYSKNINKEYKVVIVQEHAPFAFDEIVNDFLNPKILMIIRDPRASLAGFYKGLNKKFPTDTHDIYNYFFNLTTEQWLVASEMYYKHRILLKDNLFIVKNEKMVSSLFTEMTLISRWLGVSFSETMLMGSSPNKSICTPDSCYLDRGEQPEDINKYYLPANVRSRWLGELSDKEINMIEQLLYRIMTDFSYKPINNRNFYNIILSYFSFIHPHRGCGRFRFYKPTKNEFLRKEDLLIYKANPILRYIFKFLPIWGKVAYIYLSTILMQINILFDKDRWKRYDDPILDKIYRKLMVK